MDGVVVKGHFYFIWVYRRSWEQLGFFCLQLPVILSDPE